MSESTTAKTYSAESQIPNNIIDVEMDINIENNYTPASFKLINENQGVYANEETFFSNEANILQNLIENNQIILFF